MCETNCFSRRRFPSVVFRRSTSSTQSPVVFRGLTALKPSTDTTLPDPTWRHTRKIGLQYCAHQMGAILLHIYQPWLYLGNDTWKIGWRWVIDTASKGGRTPPGRSLHSVSAYLIYLNPSFPATTHPHTENTDRYLSFRKRRQEIKQVTINLESSLFFRWCLQDPAV